MTDVAKPEPLKWKQQDMMENINKVILGPLDEIRKALVMERDRLQKQVNEMKSNG